MSIRKEGREEGEMSQLKVLSGRFVRVSSVDCEFPSILESTLYNRSLQKYISDKGGDKVAKMSMSVKNK